MTEKIRLQTQWYIQSKQVLYVHVIYKVLPTRTALCYLYTKTAKIKIPISVTSFLLVVRRI